MRNRLSFTMVELVFVIAVVGILAAMIARRGDDTSLLSQARDQIISHIRYAQYLALTDDRFIPSMDFIPDSEPLAYREAMVRDWRNSMWRFQIHDLGANSNNNYKGVSYSVYSERPTRNGVWKNQPQGHSIIARDPISNKCLSYISKNNLPNECKNDRDKRLRLKDIFNVVRIEVSSQCGQNKTSETIFFDALGVPYCGSTKGGNKPVKLTEDVRIVIKSGDLLLEGKEAVICVLSQTGAVLYKGEDAQTLCR
ncbi:MAG: pilus assembly FimT family protein [Wolinella sp.]